MENSVKLCGGTFFLILLDVKKNTARQRHTDWYTKDVITERNVFAGLLQIIKPSYKAPYNETFKTNVSKYKACKIDAPDQWPMNDPTLKQDFDQRVKTDYSEKLKQMQAFTDHFLDTDDPVKIEAMIRRLLSVLKDDTGIKDTKLIYANADGTPVSKIDLVNKDIVCLESLLLGLWHFIVMNRAFNTIGRQTYDYWTKVDVPNDRRKIFWNRIDTLGRDVRFYRSTEVTNAATAPTSSEDKTSPTASDRTKAAAPDKGFVKTDHSAQSTGTTDADHDTDTQAAEDKPNDKKHSNSTADNRKQTVNIWNNYGNGLQVENLGTLNWHPGKKE